MKASGSPEYVQNGDFVTMRVDDRDDALWRSETFPVALIIYDAARDVAFYIHYQSVAQTTRRSVRIPTTSRFDAGAAKQLRDVENAAIRG